MSQTAQLYFQSNWKFERRSKYMRMKRKSGKELSCEPSTSSPFRKILWRRKNIYKDSLGWLGMERERYFKNTVKCAKNPFGLCDAPFHQAWGLWGGRVAHPPCPQTSWNDCRASPRGWALRCGLRIFLHHQSYVAAVMPLGLCSVFNEKLQLGNPLLSSLVMWKTSSHDHC